MLYRPRHMPTSACMRDASPWSAPYLLRAARLITRLVALGLGAPRRASRSAARSVAASWARAVEAACADSAVAAA